MPERAGYIWVEDAVKEYHRSRTWLDTEVREGRLTYAKFDGDRRIYLLRSELDKRLGKPIEEGRKTQTQEDAG